MSRKRRKRATTLVKSLWRDQSSSKFLAIGFVVVFAGLGIYLLAASQAAAPYATSEAENGTLSSGANLIGDANASGGSAVKFGGNATASSCPNFITMPSATPAFCDTFNVPDPTSGTRSGDLNGVVWGVSRATSSDNYTQNEHYNWASVRLGTINDATSGTSACGTLATVTDPNEMRICNGQMIESTNDDGGQVNLAAYPRQPFDFAGRTGIVAFDVSDNTQGEHAAWPAFVISDQPVPAPYGDIAALADNARNSIGVDLDVLENNDPNCLTASIWSTSNNDYTLQSTNQDGCVKSSTALGVMNHVEVQVNATSVKVFMSDAGNPASLKLIADASFAVPLSRGLVWFEDVHYNADKFTTQQSNSFAWDNLAFDGPILPRDLGYDILDNDAPDGPALNGLPTNDNGFQIDNSSGLTFTWNNVSGVSNATGALLVLNYWPWDPQNLIYSVNGNPAHTYTWPYTNDVTTHSANGTFVSQTAGLPIPVTELRNGTNTIKVTTSDNANATDIANLDLILVGSGGTHSPSEPIE